MKNSRCFLYGFYLGKKIAIFDAKTPKNSLLAGVDGYNSVNFVGKAEPYL